MQAVSKTHRTGTNSNSSDNVIYAWSTRINISDIPLQVSFQPASQAECWLTAELAEDNAVRVVPTYMGLLCVSWTPALNWISGFSHISLRASSKETD